MTRTLHFPHLLIRPLIPCVDRPDRVGILRKLRHGASLKKEQGKWILDLTERRAQHKVHTPLKRYMSPTDIHTSFCFCTDGSLLRSLEDHHQRAHRPVDHQVP